MASEEKIQLMPLGEIKPYEDAPFKVRLDENMEELVESIKENGVLVPTIARPHTDGGVEMLAGHRRLKACELAGLDNLPVIVKNLDDDTAIILLVDSNLHREDILPSEKAFAYQMKLEAMKRQGKRSDLTCEQVAYKSDKKKSSEILGEQVGESKDQIRRYIRLTNLIDPILEMVDNKQIAFNAAVELSYVTGGKLCVETVPVATKTDTEDLQRQIDNLKKQLDTMS